MRNRSESLEYQTERLDHLGIVTGVCREDGIAAWLDAQAGENRREVSRGTVVVAMILKGMMLLRIMAKASALNGLAGEMKPNKLIEKPDNWAGIHNEKPARVEQLA